MQVEHIRNGMPVASLGPDGWRKPWSDNGGDCLEAKKAPRRPGRHSPVHRPGQPRFGPGT